MEEAGGKSLSNANYSNESRIVGVVNDPNYGHPVNVNDPRVVDNLLPASYVSPPSVSPVPPLNAPVNYGIPDLELRAVQVTDDKRDRAVFFD